MKFLESSKVLKILAILIWAVGGTALLALFISDMASVSGVFGTAAVYSSSFFAFIFSGVILFTLGLLVWLQGCKYARKEQKQGPVPSKPAKPEPKAKDETK